MSTAHIPSPLLLLICLVMPSLPVTAETRPAPTAEAVNRASQALAGMVPADGETLAQTPAWKSHEAAMQKAWSRYEASTLGPMGTWAGTEVTPRSQGLRVVRYLFSGPDVLHVLRIFPQADTYILCGLEPVGLAPDLSGLSDRQLAQAFAEVRKSLEEIIQFSFFKTKDMKVDLTEATFPGTLPIMCLFLAHSGYSVTAVEYFKLGADGALAAAGERGAGADVVKLATRSQAGAAKAIYYFRTNVADGVFEKSGFLKFLQSQPPGVAYLKAASYLLHESYFSKVRGHLLGSSRVLVQDDSGIPLKYFDRGQWSLAFHGSYTRPIDLFKGTYQADLDNAFRAKGTKPLPFGTGYRWRKNESNLLVASRDAAGPEVVVSTVPKAIPLPGQVAQAAVAPPRPPGPVVPEDTVRKAIPLPGQVVAATAPPVGEPARAILRLELLGISSLDDPQAVPGGKALGVYEYKVTGVEGGDFPGTKIRIAHGILWDGQPTSIASRRPGWSTSLEVVPMSTYPSLKRLPLEDDLPADPSLPAIYVPSLD